MKIAVIGSGVSGIGAVWALNEYSDHEIHLFEADDYLGGHTHTVQFKVPVGQSKCSIPTNVDTGFIVQTHISEIILGHESSYVSELFAILKFEEDPNSGN
jgi:predicted NAD/FAD-binding protein